ncbi:acyl-CoA dehydrogenase family protein [Streptosporangium sp. NPDC002607]
MTPTTAAERQEFRTVVRAFLTERSPESRVRGLIDDERGADLDTWRQMAAQLGLAGVLIPEEFGGQGLGQVEMAVVLQEAARVLLCAPLLSSGVLAPTALLGSGDVAAAKRYLPAIAEGRSVAAVGIHDERGTRTVAESGPDGWRLTGRKTRVTDGQVADLLLLVAPVGQQTGLFAVERNAPGVTVEELDGLDRTRRQVTVDLARTPAVRIGDDFTRPLERLLAVGAVAAAAEQLGVAERMLEISVEYVKTREQFDRPIGSFQAVKHLCAEMFALVECSGAAVNAASRAAAEDPAALAEIAAVAKAYCSVAATRVVETAIQVHGGIGYTWEHPAHLYLRRAKSLEFMFGDPHHHRDRIGVLNGL